MTNSILSPLQSDAIALAREINSLADENPFKPNPDHVAKFKNLKLVWRDAKYSAPDAPGAESGIDVGYYFDNTEWMRNLAAEYNGKFADRVESVRLQFVAAKVLVPEEEWYTRCFMSQTRIRMVASYLVAAAFLIDGIRLAPSVPTGSLPESGVESIHIG